MRYVVVIDGEHYPQVTESVFKDIAAEGHEIVAAVLAGGKEKLSDDLDSLAGVEVRAGEDPRAVLEAAIADTQPDAVIDLSDDPVLDYRNRHRMASVALFSGVGYMGADFSFTPPPRPRLATRPSVAVIGTGKRTGKTAVAGAIARRLKEAGVPPVIVAMGRGGPPEPEVLRGDQTRLTPEDLLALVDSGKHGASDYIEDALLAQVPTVGCRRCGGGLAGGIDRSNVPEGVVVANELPGEVVLLEGSGSSIPPLHADATVLVVPASVPDEYLMGYMGPYRLLLTDLAVITMCEEPFGSPFRVSAISTLMRDAYRSTREDRAPKGEIRVVRTVFRPVPTESLAGADVFVATTAPEEAAGALRRHLEEVEDCRVVGITHALSDRKKLEVEIAEMKDRADVLVCEIKAAGVDVATRQAMDVGLRVVYMDNRPMGLDGEDFGGEIDRVVGEALTRFGADGGAP